jgi:hypothetical protein
VVYRRFAHAGSAASSDTARRAWLTALYTASHAAMRTVRVNWFTSFPSTVQCSCELSL